jgi:tetratricopeptide (TPR) repeat protein
LQEKTGAELMTDSREITRLRKAGQIKEALELARQVMREDSYDIWNVRAYGWALYYAIKMTVDRDLGAAKRLVEEFNTLNIPETEDLLLSRREYYSGLTDPSFQLLQQAKAKSKDREYSEALKLYRQAVRQSPQSKEACEGLAWELWRCLKDLPKNAQEGQIVPLLHEYKGLHAVEKPSDIHSRILERATWVEDRLPNHYIQFVKWWGLENIRYEDRQQQYSQNSGKYFNSLVERIIKALHQAGKKHNEMADFLWISKFIGDNYEKFPEQEWFPYYYGKALAKTGNLDAAREIVFPIVRAKQTEFWAWDVLASTYTDPKTKKACLCKSLLCKVKSDSFRVNVHLELADLLQSEGAYPEAKKEILTAVEIRSKKGWKIPGDLQNLQQHEWFINTEAVASNEAFYKSYASDVQDILTARLPWVDALVTGRREGTKDKKPLLFVGTGDGQSLDEVPVNPSKFPHVKELPIGSPVRLKTDTFGNKKIVVAMEERDGDEWDLLPSTDGVVSHMNNAKEIVHVTTSRKEFRLLHYNRLPDVATLKLGMFVEIKMKKDPKRNRNHPVSFRVIDMIPEGNDYYKAFDGHIRINEWNPFGFVDDHYVTPALIQEFSLEDHDHVSGSSVCEWNERKRKYTWRVIRINGGE